MGVFLGHSRCPSCDSADNLSVWDDGAKCMGNACNYRTFDADDIALFSQHLTSNRSKGKKRMNSQQWTPPVLKPITKKWRGISPETFARFGVGLDDNNNVHFPYYVDGVHVGSKVRSATEKKFWFDGESSGVQLFGMQCANGDRRIIVTEGEMDAMAATEMTGYPATSVPFGADSATKHVKATLRWLESFDEVVLCFDADKPGTEAQSDCLKMLAPGKVKSMVLPIGYKDANDMLIAGKGHEFKQAYYSAQTVYPSGVLSRADMIDRTLAFNSDRKRRVGMPTGYDGLDALIGGFREGDVITFTAGTGKGKSTITRNLAYRQAIRGVKSLYIPLEDLTEVAMTRFCEMQMGASLLKSDVEPDPEALRAALEVLLDNVTVLDQKGGMSVDELVNTIGYVVRENDVKVVVLDHITAMANSVQGMDERKALDTCIEALKLRVAVALKCCVVVVSHISRDSADKDDNKPTLNRLKGASSIAQYSDCVLALTLDPEDSVTTVTTLKHHRIWGQSGEFKLEWSRQSQQLEEVVATPTTAVNLLDQGQADAPVQNEQDTTDSTGKENEVDVRAGHLEPEPTGGEGCTVRGSEDQIHDEPHVHTRPAATKRHSRGAKGSADRAGQGEDVGSAEATPRLPTRTALPE